MTDLLSSLPKVGIAGGLHLLVFGAFLPFLAIRDRYQRPTVWNTAVDNWPGLRETAVTLGFYGLLSLIAAHVERIDLFTREVPSLLSIATGVLLLGAIVVHVRRRMRVQDKILAPFHHLYASDTARERAWWIVISVLAGVGEEITWRGVQTVVLHSLVGNYALAVLISSVMFGAMHAYYGWRSAVLIGVEGLGLGGVVWLSGSLYVAMVVHVAHDLMVGLSPGGLGRAFGYRVDRERVAEAKRGDRRFGGVPQTDFGEVPSKATEQASPTDGFGISNFMVNQMIFHPETAAIRAPRDLCYMPSLLGSARTFDQRARWSTSPPTTPGIYWVRIRAGGQPRIAILSGFGTGGVQVVGESRCDALDVFEWWSEPIKPPS